MDQYYKVNISRMSARELWRHSPGPVTASLLIVLKTLRLLTIKDKTLHRVAPFAELIRPEADLSQTARAALSAPMVAFRQAGFEPAVFHKLGNPYDPKSLDSGAVFLLHSGAEHVAMAAYIKRSERRGIVEKTALGIFSVMQSGRRVGVTNMKAYLDPAGKNQISYVATENPARLLAEHERLLLPLRHHDALRKIDSVRELERHFDYFQNQEVEARKKRGLFEPPTAEEMREAQMQMQSAAGRS